MAHLRADRRRTLGRQAAAVLADRLGGVTGKTIEIRAGARYVAAIRPPLESMGATITLPLACQSIGQELHWYAAKERTGVDGGRSRDRSPRSGGASRLGSHPQS